MKTFRQTTTALCAFCGLAAASLSFQASAAVYTLQIPDTAPWFDTGINLAAGDQMTITASGTVTYGYSNGQYSDPNGYGPLTSSFTTFPLCVFPDTMAVSLIGKTGGTTVVGTGTPLPGVAPGMGTGFVGTFYNQTITSGGRLFLGFNDQVGGFWDNSGFYSVTVSVVTVPEPSTYALLVLCLAGFWSKRVR